MKFIKFVSILFLTLITFSCDTEDARTPLGITVSASDFEKTIEENPENGTVLGTLNAFASDGSTIRFGNIIEADSDDSKFESETPIGALDINNDTGELTVKDGSLFDFDLNTEINASVNAISGQVEEAININIFLNPDRGVLIELFLANEATTTLDWDTTETDISNWTGVTVIDGRVTELDLSEKGLTELPTSISKISELTNLNLSDNDLSSLPESIASLNNLTTLNVSTNQLNTLPETIGNFVSLTNLNLSSNLLTNDIPDSVANLTSLTSLDISSNSITLLSVSICEAFNDFTDESFIKDSGAVCEEEVTDNQ